MTRSFSFAPSGLPENKREARLTGEVFQRSYLLAEIHHVAGFYEYVSPHACSLCGCRVGPVAGVILAKPFMAMRGVFLKIFSALNGLHPFLIRLTEGETISDGYVEKVFILVQFVHDVGFLCWRNI